jgi:hypothetical protein
MKIIENTYPRHSGVAHANPEDEVRWEASRGCFRLIRLSDGKAVFATGPVDREGLLRSNGKPPIVSGVIAEVKSKGWRLAVE